MINLKFNISEIIRQENISKFIESYWCSDIQDLIKHQKVSVSFYFSVIENQILLKGEIKGTLTLECSRCLENFLYPIKIKINRLYPINDNEEIDIGDELKQLLILNLPNKPLCKKGCSGLCSKCGKNLNYNSCQCSVDHQDPRWEKLKLLKFGNKKKSNK